MSSNPVLTCRRRFCHAPALGKSDFCAAHEKLCHRQTDPWGFHYCNTAYMVGSPWLYCKRHDAIQRGVVTRARQHQERQDEEARRNNARARELQRRARAFWTAVRLGMTMEVVDEQPWYTAGYVILPHGAKLVVRLELPRDEVIAPEAAL